MGEPSVSSIEQERQKVSDFLRLQTCGPANGSDEVLGDPPDNRYISGVLYPQSSESAPGQGADDATVAMANTWEPSSAGMTFVVRAGTRFDVATKAAVYVPSDRHVWQRTELNAEVRAFSADDPGGPWLVFGSRAEVRIASRERLGVRVVTVWLVNCQEAGDSKKDKSSKCLCQVELTVSVPGDRLLEYSHGRQLRTDEERQFAVLYRDVHEFAVGHGCAVAVTTSGDGHALSLDFMPSAKVDALLPLEATSKDDWARLAYLADNTINDGDLIKALGALPAHYQAWIEELDPNDPGIPESLHATASAMKAKTIDAHQRIQDGIEFLKNDPAAMEAFRRANLAMLMQMRHSALVAKVREGDASRRVDTLSTPLSKYLDMPNTWRPFQLAFALMVLPSVADQGHADRELVDLLWFPTGGGKTEAYLLVVSFAVIYRRLVDGDKGAGTVALSRYTLRLLTSQQFERAATLVSALEILRGYTTQADTRALWGLGNRSWGEEQISLALWVGSSLSANSCSKAHEAFKRVREAVTPKNPFLVERCPWCGTRLLPERHSSRDSDYGVRSSDAGFQFFCPNEKCNLHEEIPIRVVDDVIYSAPLPTVVIGTVDKFAQLAWKADAGRLLGADGHLPPSLIIQDELHLASGPLGTLMGAYETAVEGVIKLRGGNPKIIASTATISNAHEQVLQLFARNCELFPPSGLKATDSYFAVATEGGPSRLYLGIMAPAKTPETALIYITSSMLAAPVQVKLSDEASDAWWTLVTYHSATEHHGKMSRLVMDDVSKRLDTVYAGIRKLGYDTVESLTGNTPGEMMPRIMARMRRRRGEAAALDVVMATSTLSVGVDISRLGLMLVDRQPKTTAEYIQVTGRVGRSKSAPGLVVVFYASSRARDRSHFESFDLYHRSLNRFVEPTSVTPFSPPARDRALPSILVTLVRQGLGLSDNADAAKVLETTELDRVRRVVQERVQRIDPDEQEATMRRVDELLGQWIRLSNESLGRLHYCSNSRQIQSLMKQYGHSGPEWPVLNNLRNVDASVEVEWQ